MAKVVYDKKTNIVNVRLKDGKIVDSEIHGNCVMDYNSKGEEVNMEVLDFNLEKVSKRKS